MKIGEIFQSERDGRYYKVVGVDDTPSHPDINQPRWKTLVVAYNPKKKCTEGDTIEWEMKNAK